MKSLVFLILILIILSLWFFSIKKPADNYDPGWPEPPTQKSIR